MEIAEVRLEELEAQLKKQESELDALCSRPRAAQKLGEKLTEQISKELEDLGMPGAKIQCEFREKGYSENGRDEVSLLASLNPGQPLRHLSKVASGEKFPELCWRLKVLLPKKKR